MNARENASWEDLPSYVSLLESGELDVRVAALEALSVRCRLCPRECTVDRQKDERGECGAGCRASLVSYGPHHGEEACLSGRRGSGTLFFGHCNLHCVFCQNFEISQDHEASRRCEVEDEAVADAMLRLQEMGCHNINWVSPTHQLAAVGRALAAAAGRGLRLPIVYNSNGYDSLEALQLLEGVVDIYMPDLKYADEELAGRLSEAPGYVKAARAAIREMHRQVGSLALDKEGIARRGVLIRHLVMPEDLSGTFNTLTWIAETLGRDTTVNLMAQYHPAYRAHRHPVLGRRVTWEEYGAAVDHARSLGLSNLLIQR